MTLQQYPSFSSDTNLLSDLRRVAQLRSDDAKIIQSLQDSVSYKQGFYPNVREVSANTTVGKFDYHIEGDATSGAITITLPNDETIGCRELVISKKDSSGNAVTISGNGKNINGSSTTSAATQYSFKRLHYLPTVGEWRIL